jgi:hypothetical protein
VITVASSVGRPPSNVARPTAKQVKAHDGMALKSPVLVKALYSKLDPANRFRARSAMCS